MVLRSSFLSRERLNLVLDWLLLYAVAIFSRNCGWEERIYVSSKEWEMSDGSSSTNK